MKKTILGGVLFLVPVVFAVILLSKAFELSLRVAKPLDRLVPIESVGGVALANIIAIIIILAICYLAGLLALRGPLAKRIKKIEDLLIDIVPGYVVAKGIIGGVTNTDDGLSVLKPVLAKFDDYEQLAFEVERTDKMVVVFLPGSPSAWSGTSVLVDPKRITPLDLAPHQINSMLRVLGRGSAKIELPDR